MDEQEKNQMIRRRVLIGLAAAAAVILGIVLFLNSWIRPPEIPDVTNPGPTDPALQPGEGEDLELFDGAEIPAVALSGRREGVYTFLVVGRDTGGGGNTDTMLLLTYDVNAKTIHGLSLPRDTMINTKSASKRLNAVYNYNKGRDKETQVEKGMSALKKQVSKLTGIVPDFYVLVEWEAVGKLVDALGGVYFDVPFDMNYDDPAQNLHIHQQAGYRKLSGDDAMQVIRHRKNNDGTHSDGDVGRLKVQQDFLKAAAAECLKPSTLLKAPALAQIFLENVNTDLSVGNILYFAQMAMGMDAEEGVSFVTMPYTDARHPSASMVLPIESELLEILNDGMNPYLDSIQSSDLELLYRKSGGGYGVTHGTLADPSLAYPPAPKPAPEPEPDPEETETDPDTDPEVETPPPGVPLDPIDPSDIFPELPDPEPNPDPVPDPGPDPDPAPDPDPVPDPLPAPDPDPLPDPEPVPDPLPDPAGDIPTGEGENSL